GRSLSPSLAQQGATASPFLALRRTVLRGPDGTSTERLAASPHPHPAPERSDPCHAEKPGRHLSTCPLKERYNGVRETVVPPIVGSRCTRETTGRQVALSPLPGPAPRRGNEHEPRLPGRTSRRRSGAAIYSDRRGRRFLPHCGARHVPQDGERPVCHRLLRC